MTSWTQMNNDEKYKCQQQNVMNHENLMIQNKTLFRKLWYMYEHEIIKRKDYRDAGNTNTQQTATRTAQYQDIEAT